MSESTFIVGSELSAADVVSYVYIYNLFGKMSDEKKYVEFNNISRWFDTIQNQLNQLNGLSSGKFKIIKIDSKSYFEKLANKKNKKKGKGKEGKSKGGKNSQSKPEMKVCYFMFYD